MRGKLIENIFLGLNLFPQLGLIWISGLRDYWIFERATLLIDFLYLFFLDCDDIVFVFLKAGCVQTGCVDYYSPIIGRVMIDFFKQHFKQLPQLPGRSHFETSGKKSVSRL